MNIYIGSDHAGFGLKEELCAYISSLGHLVIDKGPYELNASDDYPDYIFPVAEAVAGDEGSLGIVLGYSGQGEAMCANRVRGVRAALYAGGDTEIVLLAREHNNANVLSLGSRFVTSISAKEAVRLFLETEFTREERHVRRITKLDTR